MNEVKRSLPTTGIYLDKSHPNKHGLYPIKIRVTYRRRSRYFKSGIYLSKKEYESSYNSLRPRGQFKVLRERLLDIEKKSNDIITSLEQFTFSQWEKQFYRANYDNDSLDYHFDIKIDQLNSNNQHSSAETYDNALKKIKEYFKYKRRSKEILLSELTPKTLKEIEQWMLSNNHKITTVGIYLSLIHI